VFTQAFERMAPCKCLAPGLSSYQEGTFSTAETDTDE
jgi:hypothetical protein